MNSQTISTAFNNTFPNWDLALKYINMNKPYVSQKYWMSDVMYQMHFTKERPISFIC